MVLHHKALYRFESDNDSVDPAMEQRNMRYGILHGAFFHMANAFGDPYAVIPLFLSGFIGSRLLIGLIVSLIGAVGVLPQLPIARILQRRPETARPLMLVGIWTRCAVWGFIAVITLLLPLNSTWIPILFTGLISIYSLGGGLAVLPFRRIISETIPPERRGSFFSGRLATGGMLAVLAGFIVKKVLSIESLTYPRNYGVLFLCSFGMLAVSYIAMSRFRFPKTEKPTVPHALPPFWLEIVNLLKTYPVLKRLIAVRMFSGGLILALPFLTLYATQDLQLPLEWIGFFIATQTTGTILSTLAWRPIGNKIGTRCLISSGLAIGVLGLIFVLIAKNGPALLPAFFLIGCANSGLLIGFNGYILEIGTPKNRTLLFAMEGTLLLPLYFMPLLGGLLADAFGYRSLILFGITLLVIGIGAVQFLCEPRQGDIQCGPK